MRKPVRCVPPSGFGIEFAKRQDLVVVAVVVLQDDIDERLRRVCREITTGFGMNDLLVLAELLNEFLDAVLVEKRFLLRWSTRSSVRVISSPGFRNASSRKRLARRSNLNSVVIVKIVGSGRKVISVPVFFLFLTSPMTLELLRRLAALEGHVINLAVARDFDLEPIGKRVDAFRADAVQTAGIFVGALAEFSARVQIRQDQLDRRHLEFRMHVDRNAAAVVAHRKRSHRHGR